MQQLQLRKFDPRKMADDVVVMIIGKRNTGKSILARDILSYKQHIPHGIVISPTEHAQGFFKSFVPDLYIYHEFDSRIIDNLFKVQERQIELNGGKNDNIKPAFLVLDDCMFDKSFLKTKVMRELLMNGRHYKVFILITAQYCGDIDTATRGNIDYCFVMREPIIANRKRLYENFFGMLPRLKDFGHLMDCTTENYECLVVDNTTASNKLSDALAYYKAQKDHSFKMGSVAYWRAHHDKYDTENARGSRVGAAGRVDNRALKISKVARR